MIDTEKLNQSVDLQMLVERAVGAPIGKRFFCPLCQPGGQGLHGAPALLATETRFICFKCGTGGDAITWVMVTHNVKFHEACETLGWKGEGVDIEALARAKAEREQRAGIEAVRKAEELSRILQGYTEAEIWHAMSLNMQAEQRAWWTSRGVPAEWQEYLRLGYIDRKVYRSGDHVHTSSAYTIPYFHNNEFQTIQYRLNNPERPQDRYRFEHGLPATYYQVEQTQPGEEVIICEGAIKAIVTRIWGGSKMQVLGVPSKTTFGGIEKALAESERVYIILDPDAFDRPANAPKDWQSAAVKLARLIGKAARIVRLPDKVDDMLNEGTLTKRAFQFALRRGETI